MAADPIGEMPGRQRQPPVLCHPRDLERMPGANPACALIAIGDAIEFEPHLACPYMLNRNFDVAKAERRIVARTLGIEIECADRAVPAWTQRAVARHLRIRPCRCARRQPPEPTELTIGIASTQNNLPLPASASSRRFGFET